MNINSLTIKAQEALQAAVSLAREQGNQAVEPLHLLNVLVREDDSLSVFLLGRVGVNVRGLRGEVVIGPVPNDTATRSTTTCMSRSNGNGPPSSRNASARLMNAALRPESTS